jgi:hypothetical protein
LASVVCHHSLSETVLGMVPISKEWSELDENLQEVRHRPSKQARQDEFVN